MGSYFKLKSFNKLSPYIHITEKKPLGQIVWYIYTEMLTEAFTV